MCNPRRVTIQLQRAIEQAWHATVERTASTQGEVSELARLQVDIPLDAEMGDRALETLERLLRGEFADYEAWSLDEAGDYRRSLGNLTLVYRPGSRQLMVETRLTEQIDAEARAAAEFSGFTVGEAAVEAVGHYYEDGWGGRTEERALQEAQAEAERRLAAAIEALHRQRHAAELAETETQAQAEAEAQAAAQLERLRTEMRQALRQRLQATLADSQDRVRRTLNRLVGEAYRHTLLQLVRENGGRIVSDQRSGAVIDLELEF